MLITYRSFAPLCLLFHPIPIQSSTAAAVCLMIIKSIIMNRSLPFPPLLNTIPTIASLVQMRKSNSHNVTIQAVTRNHTGLYQCEVSGDKPLFHTLTRSAQMQVAVMPQMEPTIDVVGGAATPPPTTAHDINKRYINYGDQLKASCTAGPSNPAVNFTWRVNDVVFPVSREVDHVGRSVVVNSGRGSGEAGLSSFSVTVHFE